MKRKNQKRLVLGRETIRIMEDQLANVGAGIETVGCTAANSCVTFIHGTFCECSMTGPTVC